MSASAEKNGPFYECRQDYLEKGRFNTGKDKDESVTLTRFSGKDQSTGGNPYFKGNDEKVYYGYGCKDASGKALRDGGDCKQVLMRTESGVVEAQPNDVLSAFQNTRGTGLFDPSIKMTEAPTAAPAPQDEFGLKKTDYTLGGQPVYQGKDGKLYRGKDCEGSGDCTEVSVKRGDKTIPLTQKDLDSAIANKSDSIAGLGKPSKLTTTNTDGAKDDVTASPVKEYSQEAMDKAYGDAFDKQAYQRRELAAGEGECGYSSKLDGSMTCDTTRNTVEGAKVSNALTSAVGVAATTVMGTMAQQEAAKKGTQSGLLEATADTQINTGKMQMGMGALNAVLGIAQVMQAQGHNKNVDRASRELKADTSQFGENAQKGFIKGDGSRINDHGYVTAREGSLAQKAIDNWEMNKVTGKNQALSAVTAAQGTADYQLQMQARQGGIDGKKARIAADVSTIGTKVREEQRAIASAATAGAMQSFMVGATQMINGGFNIASGNQLKEAAAKLKGIEETVQDNGKWNELNVQQPGNISAPRQANVITGDGTQTAAAAGEEDGEENAGIPDLGDGIPKLPEDKVANMGPPAGKFGGGGAGGGVMGGGGGGLGGGGGTGAAGPAEGEPSARYAEAVKTSSDYDPAGGVMTGGGGGGGGGSNGPDLSGLLAQFLPKEEDKGPANGILDFGARGQMAEQPISLLDKNANLFQRIHQTYQDKNQKGLVGL